MSDAIRQRPEILEFSDGTRWETTRSAERYGDIKLSVQASRTHYCRPRVDGLDLSDYDKVEVALIHENGDWLRPEDIGLDHLEGEWEPKTEGGSPTVGGYISQDRVDEIRERLRELADTDFTEVAQNRLREFLQERVDHHRKMASVMNEPFRSDHQKLARAYEERLEGVGGE